MTKDTPPFSHAPPPIEGALDPLALSDQAIEWVIRIHSGAPDAPEAARTFAQWRAQGPAQEAAACEAEALWQGIGGAGPAVRRVRDTPRGALTRRALIGCGALGVFGLGALALARRQMSADFATGIDAGQTVDLPDGSQVLLNASSSIALRFTEAERRVTLIDGQALFTVARNAARPFIVSAGAGWTRAVGTAFDVDMRPQGVVVTVVSGVVMVGTADGPDRPVTLQAGQRARYGAAGGVIGPEPVDADLATAWRRGKLIFDRRPLGEVVSELQRHTRARIVVASNSLKTLEVTGVFDLDDPQSVLETVEQTLPVRVLRLPWLNVIL